MKNLLIILSAAMIAVNVMAQEQPQAAAKGAQLVCSGNTYYYGTQEVMNKRQMLDWYARHNCQEAYNQFAKGRNLAKAGWTCLGLGLALDVAGVVSAGMFLALSASEQTANHPAYISMICLSVGAAALEIACIPTLIVGYHKMHHSVDVYNVRCATAKVQPYWAIQASSNGLGLAMKF